MLACYLSGARCRLACGPAAQLMPLPLTVSCFSEIQIGLTFLVPAHPGSPGKRPSNGCVCVCESDQASGFFGWPRGRFQAWSLIRKPFKRDIDLASKSLMSQGVVCRPQVWLHHQTGCCLHTCGSCYTSYTHRWLIDWWFIRCSAVTWCLLGVLNAAGSRKSTWRAGWY